MNCIIIDDEPLAINVIKSYCDELDYLNVLSVFSNPLEAINALGNESVDLILCDIEMPNINGIEFIKTLDKKPLFIFTTAYSKYALDGFEINAVDYLVKPIPFPRFVKAIQRAKKQYNLLQNRDNITVPNLTSSVGKEKVQDNFIFIKSEYDNVKINLNEIVYIQGLKDYLKVHLTDKRPLLTLMSFKEMEQKLQGGNFIRIHRSYIVNINVIDSIQRSKVLIGESRIPIGESYREYFFDRLGI